MATKNIKILDEESFDEFISKGNAVIDFYADWCGPCKVMAPEFESAASELASKVKFGKVDVDKNQGLAQRFQVMSIPTTILFKNKEQVERKSGALPKKYLLELAEKNF